MLMRSPLARERRAPPGLIQSCQPVLSDTVPTGPDWIHELKHDGFRLMVLKDGDRVRLWSRNGRDWSLNFLAITAVVRDLPPPAFGQSSHVLSWRCRLFSARAAYTTPAIPTKHRVHTPRADRMSIEPSVELTALHALATPRRTARSSVAVSISNEDTSSRPRRFGEPSRGPGAPATREAVEASAGRLRSAERSAVSSVIRTQASLGNLPAVRRCARC
jgi:hypothetical protein